MQQPIVLEAEITKARFSPNTNTAVLNSREGDIRKAVLANREELADS